jgi:hypothetical protein
MGLAEWMGRRLVLPVLLQVVLGSAPVLKRAGGKPSAAQPCIGFLLRLLPHHTPKASDKSAAALIESFKLGGSKT